MKKTEKDIIEENEEKKPTTKKKTTKKAEKEGYTFKGWDEKLTNIKQDLEVYPVFEEITFSVTFLDIYSNVIEIQKVRQGETAVAPDAPIVDYYTFTVIAHTAKYAKQVFGLLRSKNCGGLVEYQYIAVGVKRSCNGQLLPLSDGGFN